MLIEKLRDMFSNMVIQKNASLIADYYHPEFKLYTNEQTIEYHKFLTSHQHYYATEIQYQVEYDEQTLLENDDKVAARMWITTSKPNEPSRKIEVMLIAQYKQDKIYRLWELTYPDWSQMTMFKK